MGTAANEHKLQKYVVKKPGIPLHEGEICYYRGEGYSYRNHVVTTGSTGLGGGFSFRVAKHVSYHTGAGTSARIRENVPDYYPGVFYMTNQRLIMLSENLGFDMPLYKLTSVQTDGKMYRFYFGSKQYTIVPEEYRKIKKIMFLIEKPDNPPEWEKKSSSKSTSSVTVAKKPSAADEILKYKKLLDAGAISQEEYDSVKKSLLETVTSDHTEEKTINESVSKPKKQVQQSVHHEENREPVPSKQKEEQKPSVFSKMLGSMTGALKEETAPNEVSENSQLAAEEPKPKEELEPKNKLEPSVEPKPEEKLKLEVKPKPEEKPKTESKDKSQQKEEESPSVFSQMLGSVVESVAGSVKEQLSRKQESDDFEMPTEKPIFATAASITLDAWGHIEVGELKLYENCLIFESDDHKLNKIYRFELISGISTFALDTLSFIYGSKSVSFGMNNKTKKAWKKQLKEAIADFNSRL